MSLSKIVVFTFVAAGFSAPANAVLSLAPAVFTAEYSYGPGQSSYATLTGPGKIFHIGAQSASAEAITTPQSRAEVTGNTGSSTDYVGADARVQFEFFIFAPVNTRADVVISASAGAGGIGDSYYTNSYVALVGGGYTRILEAAHACYNTSGCFGTTPASTRPYNLSLFTNTIYTFDLYVDAVAKAPNTSFDVYADPTVIFDPASTPPTGAVLRINTGLTTIAGVPEPESWALLTAGFGVVGSMARRRRMVRVTA